MAKEKNKMKSNEVNENAIESILDFISNEKYKKRLCNLPLFTL